MDCSLFYNINGNDLANEKLKLYNEFVYIVSKLKNEPLNENTTNEITNIINSVNCNKDLSSLILAIPVNKVSIYNCLLIFNLIVFEIGKHCDGSDGPEFHILIRDHLKKFEDLVRSNNNLLDNEKIDKLISTIGHTICTIERLCNNKTGDYVYYLTPRTLHSIESMTEAQSTGVSDNMIRSGSDPNGSFTSVDIDKGINPCEYLTDLFQEDDNDYFIHKIKSLYDYLVCLQGNFDDEHTNAFIEAINYIVSKVIDDITGKEILIDTISKCDQLLTDTIPTDGEHVDNIEAILEKFNEITDIINTDRNGTTNLLDEMGLGYIYDILPKNESVINENIDNIVNSLNESANKFDMVSVLNESIKENIKNYNEKRKERKQKEKDFKEKKKNDEYDMYDETRDTRVDINSRKQNDEYDLERDKKRNNYDDGHELKTKIVDDVYGDHRQHKGDNYDLKHQNRQDKYDLKQQNRQDKYDFKKQKKLDKYDQKKSSNEQNKQLRIENDEQKREERTEAKQRRAEDRQRKRDETKIGLNRWKTLELTNQNARKAANALRKVVKTGAAAGTAALTGLNPIFAGSTYLISSYVKDKNNPQSERRKYIDDLHQQITEIDEKIDMSERNGESDKKLALVKMKQKLESALKRCGYLENFEADM